MTGQASDSVVFQRKEYSLAEFEGKGLFDPNNYGIQPQDMTTACWRGFVCTYKVYRRRLKLFNLSINIQSREYQKLFDVLNIDLDPKSPEIERYDRLSNLSFDVEFSGTMLIARDFIQNFYVHMGFQSAFSYQNVYALEFNQGRLEKADDVSPEMEDLRRSYVQRPQNHEHPENLIGWIEERFSRRIRKKQ
jgi:hypothetical protein